MQVRREHQDQPEHQVPLVIAELVDLREVQEVREHQGVQEVLVHQEVLVVQDLQERLAHLEVQVVQEQQEHLVIVDLQEALVHREVRDQLDPLVLLVHQDNQFPEDLILYTEEQILVQRHMLLEE